MKLYNRNTWLNAYCAYNIDDLSAEISTQVFSDVEGRDVSVAYSVYNTISA